MKKLISIVAVFLIIFNSSIAQTVPAPDNLPSAPKRNIIKLTPQHFIMKAFQIDYEVALGNKHSLQFSPSITVRENDQYKKVTGGGLEIIKKFYIGNQEIPLEGFYAGVAAAFHQYKIENDENCFYDAQTNQFICSPGKAEKIKRYALNVVFGHQFILYEVVAIDLYVGGGMRIADSNIRRDRTNNDFYYDTDIFDYNYTGVTPKIGVSFGLAF